MTLTVKEGGGDCSTLTAGTAPAAIAASHRGPTGLREAPCSAGPAWGRGRVVGGGGVGLLRGLRADGRVVGGLSLREGIG
jgi:hypothetical protein